MTDAFRLMGRVDVDTTPAERGLQSLSGKVSSFGDSFRTGLDIGAGIAAFQVGLAVLERGFSALKGSAVDFNQAMDGAGAAMSRFFVNTESLNNSMAYLNDLAAKTPFAFEGLLIAQQRTIGAARSAEELKLNMDAITVAAANTGRVSTANMDRISLALGQVQTKGHLAGGEIMQLTEAGVNIGEILAKSLGISTAAVLKLSEQGKISSQMVWQALRENAEDPRNREALEKLAKTWEGALSTIGDVSKTVIAQTFRPFFDLMTQGAIAVADFLQSADFKVWAEAARLGFVALSDGVKSLMSFFAPLGSAISDAFHKMSTGDMAGALDSISAGFQTQIDLIWTKVQAFTSGMFGGGANAIMSFADGMLQGGYAAIVGAMDAITSFIASVLIGNSPPPAGPLSQLDKGGENAAKAWVDPFSDTMQKGTATAVGGVKATIEGLRAASRDVAGSIRDINEESQGLDRTIKALKDRIGDIKDGFAETTRGVKESAEITKDRYAQAIDAIKTQIETIKDAHEHAADAIQHQIDAIKERYDNDITAVKEVIDSVKEHWDALEQGVQRQIDTIKDKYTGALEALRSKIDGIKAQEEARLTPLQKQLTLLENANKAAREQQDIQRSITQAKTQQLMLDAMGDPKARAVLAGQLAGLDVQQQRVDLAQQLAEAQEKLKSTDLTANERASLELKIKQLQIQQQLVGMVDITKLSEATQQAALADAQDKQLSVTRAIEDAHTRIMTIPIQKKITDIQAAAEAALTPLNKQLKDVEHNQKAALDPLQDKLRQMKSDEADALAPLTARLKSLERDQKIALDPLQKKLKDIKDDAKAAIEPLETKLKDTEREAKNAATVFDAMLAAIAQQQRDILKPLDDQLTAYQKHKDALSEQLQNLQRIKAEIAETIQIQQAAERAAKEAAKNGPTAPGAPAGGISFDMDARAKEQAEKMKAAGAKLAENMGEGLAKWWEDNSKTVILRVIGAIAGGLIGGPIGAVAGAAFLPKFIESLNAKLTERGFDAQPFIQAIADGMDKGDWGPVGTAVGFGLSRAIFGTIPALSRVIGAWFESLFTGDNTALQEATKTFAGGFLSGFVKYIVENPMNVAETVLTVIMIPESWLGALGTALSKIPIAGRFLAWFVDGFKNLGLLLRGGGASPISAAWESIAAGFGDDIILAFKSIPGKIWTGIGDIFKNLFTGGAGGPGAGTVYTTIETEVRAIGPRVATIIDGEFSVIGSKVGPTLVDGVKSGIVNALPRLWEFLKDGFGILSLLRRVFRSRSPSEEMADLGDDLIQGLIDGVTKAWTDRLSVWWGNLKQATFDAIGWDGSGLTWVADLKAIGSKMLEDIWDGLNAYWVQFSQWWTDLPVNIQTAFGWSGTELTWVADLKAIGSKMLESIWNGLDIYWAQFSDWWHKLPVNIQTAFGWNGTGFTWVQNLMDMGWRLLENIWDGINSYWPQFSQWWKDLPTQIQTAFGWSGGAFTWIEQLKTIGSGIITGIQEGITTKVNEMKDWLKSNFVDNLPVWLRDLLGIHSPSALMVPIGEALIAGIIQGLENKMPDIRSALAKITGMMGGGGGAALTSDALDTILHTAIQKAGVGQDWFSGLRWLVDHEDSTLEPGRQNPEPVVVGGVNYGHATGLGQLLPGTFSDNRDPDLPDDITNPLSNLVAMIRYIQGAYYANGRNLDWIISHWADRGGYATGGIAWGPQVANLAEREPEVIIPRSWFANQQGGSSFRNDSLPSQTHRFVVADPSGRVLADWYVTGRVEAIKQGRVPSATS